MTEREERIRRHARRLWQEEGRPEGEQIRFWEMAERLIEQEDAALRAARQSAAAKSSSAAA